MCCVGQNSLNLPSIPSAQGKRAWPSCSRHSIKEVRPRRRRGGRREKAAAAGAKGGEAAAAAEKKAERTAFDQEMGVAPEAIPMGTPVAMQRRGSWLGFFGFAATAGASSSSSTQPTLLEMTEILKRELGLDGNMTDVVKQAAGAAERRRQAAAYGDGETVCAEAGGEAKALKDTAAAAPLSRGGGCGRSVGEGVTSSVCECVLRV